MKIRRIKKLTSNDIIVLLFLITMALRSFTAPYESAGMISQIKYGVCIAAMCFTYAVMKKRHSNKLFKRERDSIFIMVGVFALISVFCIIFSASFTGRTLLELIYLWLPAMYAYVLINTLPFEKIYSSMCVALLLFLAGYFLNLGLSLSEIFSGLSTVSFGDSFSVLESSVYAGPAVTMAIFFLYYWKKNKIITALSVLFVFLTFKRIAMVFTMALLVLTVFVDMKAPVKLSVVRLAKCLTFLATVAYFFIMQPDVVEAIYDLLSIDLYKFTMSRTYRFSLIYDSSFISSGLGASHTFLMNRYDVSLEMDLLKIWFELSPIGVIVIINQMFNVAKKSRYCFFVMLYEFCNMLFSHSLADMFGWLILYITFACIQYKTTNYAY